MYFQQFSTDRFSLELNCYAQQQIQDYEEHFGDDWYPPRPNVDFGGGPFKSHIQRRRQKRRTNQGLGQRPRNMQGARKQAVGQPINLAVRNLVSLTRQLRQPQVQWNNRQQNSWGLNDHWTQTEMAMLYVKSLEFAQNNSKQMQPISWLYRDKSHEYFSEIFYRQEHPGIMWPYLKDPNGDPLCPINGRLSGLFFATKMGLDGLPLQRTVFGGRRFNVPVWQMFELCQNMYFADFYCFSGPHWVTLVMTQSNSPADVVCRQHLIKLDPYDNPFLVGPGSDYGSGWVATGRLIVEVIITMALDLNLMMRTSGAYMENVERLGQRNGPKKKDPNCPSCNLYTDADIELIV